MIQAAKANLGFLIPFLWFLLGGAILLFFIERGDVLLYFNETRTDFWTTFFCYFTKVGEEGAYILLALLFAYFINYRASLSLALAGLLTGVLSFLLKTYFAHPRPKTYFWKNGMLDEIDLPQGYDLYHGLTSFPSGHTMSAFALFGLVALTLSGKNLLGFCLFVVAFLIGFSRIYLFQHFFEDVFLGALLGFLIAIFLKYVLQKSLILSSQFWEKSLQKRKNSA